jgi:hypothetical protein
MGDGGEKPALQVIVLVSLPVISPVVRPCSVHADLYMSFMRPHHSPTHQPYEWIGLSFLSRSLCFCISSLVAGVCMRPVFVGHVVSTMVVGMRRF